jgi:hypothetical protein
VEQAMIFKHIKKLHEEWFAPVMTLICINFLLNMACIAWVAVGSPPIWVMVYCTITYFFMVFNILWHFIESREYMISSFMEDCMSSMISIGGSWVSTLFAAVFIFLETETMRNIRYRGYLLPTKSNKVDHMARVIAGDIMEVPPDDFR